MCVMLYVDRSIDREPEKEREREREKKKRILPDSIVPDMNQLPQLWRELSERFV